MLVLKGVRQSMVNFMKNYSRKQFYAILSLVIIGSFFSTVYATTVLDTTSVFQNLTVLGTCTGCGGGGSGSFTSYSTALNETLAGTSSGTNIGLFSSIDGSTFEINTSGKSSITFINGTVKVVTPTAINFDSSQVHIAQSPDGKYKAIITSGSKINLYKNNALLQTIGINLTQFATSNTDFISISLSSDGKYISVCGQDSGGGIQRLVVFIGS